MPSICFCSPRPYIVLLQRESGSLAGLLSMTCWGSWTSGALALTRHAGRTGMGIRMGPKRTRLYGLNLSRCLGDKFLKDQDLGLSAVPHVSDVVCLEPAASGVVVLASDGLWDVADGDAALKARPLPSLSISLDQSGASQWTFLMLPLLVWDSPSSSVMIKLAGLSYVCIKRSRLPICV